MKMNRERKIYAGVLGLALVALTADKLFLSPGASQAASPANLLVSGAPHAAPRAHVVLAAKPPPPVEASNPLSLAGLIQRMRQVRDQEQLDLENCPDVFHAPKSWTPQLVVQSTAKQQFLARHRLVAVLKSGHGGLAVLDGGDRKSVRPGQMVDGFRLVRLGEQTATFESKEGAVDLQIIPDPPPAAH